MEIAAGIKKRNLIMTTNTVSPETGRALAAEGFPQPAPAQGQWWNRGAENVFISDSRTKYFTVVRYYPGAQPLVDAYFDLQDFDGLVYLPTVEDILREASNHFAARPVDSVEIRLSTTDDKFQVDIFENLPFDSMNPIWQIHEHAAEAAALAWSELKK